MSKIKQDNLTAKQSDYAMFLPSISSFYVNYISKQYHEEFVKKSRIPFANGMEALNFFNEKEGNFTYKWALYSGGHAVLDINKPTPQEDMMRKRDRSKTWVLGDSGGFQIAKGVWDGDWKDPSCPKAQKKRELVLAWLDEYMDYSMVLDIPAWLRRIPGASDKTGIYTFDDAVNGTRYNHDYFMANRKGSQNGGTKFLNVLQGENHAESDEWYRIFKDYCDPKVYPETHFEGWAFGGQNMCDLHLTLRRIVDFHFDGLLEEGVHDVIHLLGMSKLEWAIVLTEIQRVARKYYNPALQITFDAASPFLATANGRIYTSLRTDHNTKWTYKSEASLDDASYSNDTRMYKDAVISDGHYEVFDDSPIMDECQIKDICCYPPGSINKQGNVAKTSWDTFSYAIQMGHNVWSHINAVQQGNADYDAGQIPRMLIPSAQGDGNGLKGILDMIFSCDKREDAHAIIDYYDKYWMQIPGSRGLTGKKTKNASGQFDRLFNVIEDEMPAAIETPITDKLEELEDSIHETQFSKFFT
jgi:hypothetical protein